MLVHTSARRRRAALAHACVACHKPWALRVVRTGGGGHVLVCRFCSWRREPVDRATPAPRLPEDATCPSAPTDHEVLLYDDQPSLQHHLTSCVERDLQAGDSCIVIATAEHRTALRERLGPSLLVPAVRRGAFVELDARDTLHLFLRDGRPDPELFHQTVGAFVRDQLATGRPLHAYGELVALLWADGQVAAALELEALWNGLQRELGVSLLCAYPANDVVGDEDAVRAPHSALVA